MDHLDGELMWSEMSELNQKLVPRRLERTQSIKEIENDQDKFVEENEKYILQFWEFVLDLFKFVSY